LTLTGTNFNGNSVVRWNGTTDGITITSVGSTSITVTVAAGRIPTSGSGTVTVFNPLPGGGTSSGATVTVNNPAPTATALHALVGSSRISDDDHYDHRDGFHRGVAGSPFDLHASPDDFRQLDDFDGRTCGGAVHASRFPTFVGLESDTGGGATGDLVLNVENTVPIISSVTPTTVIRGSTPTFSIIGTGFNASSVVQLDGSTTGVTQGATTPTTMTATVSSTLTATTGTRNLTVFNHGPGGGTGGPVTISIVNPMPTVTSISPSSFTTTSPPSTLAITGSNFISGAIVKWNGSAHHDDIQRRDLPLGHVAGRTHHHGGNL
jgi:hypothetical protein